MALQGCLATRLVGLAGEVHGLPWHCCGTRLSCLVCYSVGNAAPFSLPSPFPVDFCSLRAHDIAGPNVNAS